MKFHLRSKILLGIVAVAAISFLWLALFVNTLIQKELLNEEIDELYKDANYIASLYRSSQEELDRKPIEGMAYATSSMIWIMDTDRQIRLSSTNDTIPAAALQAFAPLGGNDGYYMIGDFYGTFGSETLTVYASLTKNAQINGYVLIHKPMSVITVKANRMQIFAYVTFGITIALLIIFFVYLNFLIIRPVEKLVKAGHEFLNNNLTYPLEVHGRDELNELALLEKELAGKLSARDEDQHRFMANISHDFRSPLTSIRGYIVAIQDGTIPPEMQDKYLQVILDETDRLMNLSNSLLDITQLEGGLILQKTSFDIHHLIRKILPTFEQRMREKNLTFEVIFEEESQSVFADYPRIEQVLHNLIDNAIKFSRPDEAITISTRTVSEKVFISVKDAGIGIREEDIPKIWNRFYKTDASRGKDKKGSGLGLSIVREIIQAHKENIDCISTEGVGTEFIFTMPEQDSK